jgi:hypothetical protein
VFLEANFLGDMVFYYAYCFDPNSFMEEDIEILSAAGDVVAVIFFLLRP